jgi:sugar phosphate isomerase/epimerase
VQHMTRREILAGALAASSLWPLRAGEIAATHGFKLGIITDEVTNQLDDSLAFISEYGLRWCELREIWANNILNAPQEDLARAKKIIEQHKIQVSDIASPIFKWNLPQVPAKANEKRDEFKASFTEPDADPLLEKSFRIARHFGTQKVRIFSYWRVDDPDKAYPYVRDRLAKAADLAAKNDIILVLENEHSCNVGTGKELGRLLKEVNSPNLRGVWDPGNAVMLGEVPFPDGYNAVRGMFPHMHIKDVRKNNQTGKMDWAPVGGGVIDFKGQFRALHHDEYEGTMSLETHYRRADGNKAESTRESLEGLLKVV